MAAAQQAVVQQWFGLADEDRDGAIAGVEAVKFFSRSGLDQATLGQVWELASGGGAKLNQAQFFSAVRLIALAQAQGGRLPLEQARVVMAGMGPTLPLPRMLGMEQYSPQTTGMNPQGSFASAGYVPQFTGASNASQTAAPYAPQFTGSGYTPQMTGSATGPAGGFAPATAADLQRYQAAFQQLDSDRDGVVQGSDCFGYFMQWGLDKTVLRHIWEIVAGTSSNLTQAQLTSCLYLMDAAKRGVRPPLTLPPGPFPPVAQQWSLQSQFGGAGASSAAPAASQQAVVMPSMPNLPTKFTEPEQPLDGSASAARASQVPDPNMTGLAQDQREKLASELRLAAQRESQLFTVEEKAAQTKARIAAYNAAMQEVTMFKSRTDVALLQAQDQVSRLEEELVMTRGKYDKSHAAAQSQGETARKLREYLGKLMADKTEQEGKLLQLEAEIAAANAVTPADVQRMEAEVRALHERIAAQETMANSKGAQVSGFRQQRTTLEARLAELKAAAAAADGEVQAMQKQVSELQAAISAARTGGGSSEGGMASLLTRAAQLYRNLFAATTKSGAAIPFDALPANLGLASWMDDAMEGVVNWNDLDDDARGYVLVNAMPGQRIQLEKGKTTPAPAAATPAAGAAPAAAAAAAGSAPAAAAAPASAAAATAPAAGPAAVDAFGEAPAFGASGFGDAPAFPAAPSLPAATSVAAQAPAAPAPAPPAAPAAAATPPAATTFASANSFEEAPAFPAGPTSTFGAAPPFGLAVSASGAPLKENASGAVAAAAPVDTAMPAAQPPPAAAAAAPVTGFEDSAF